MLEVCSRVTNEKEKDGVYKRSGQLRSEGPRETGAPLQAMCSSVCLRSEPDGSVVCVLVNLVDLMKLKGLSLNQLDQPGYLGESASPFIDEGDGLIGEREIVRMLLSLVAHADEDSDDGRRPQCC